MTAAVLSHVYSVDTSPLLDGLERYYVEETFPGIWEKVAQLIDSERFFISEEVYEEVVTGEGSDGTEDRPKIPYVCGKLRIPCTRFTELIRAEGWVFKAG